MSSMGEASEVQYKIMGVYKRVEDQIVYGRPVWKHNHNDLFIFYSGNIAIFKMMMSSLT